ncbi:MAG: exodeoxyribonuclease VII large subunit, partial [Flavobacteriaceae bacterium]|nr:exodeoxyribonuclease VII large subunit [Flavobacteriaceae bacterium]
MTKSLQNMILEHYNGYFWIQAEIAKLNFYPRTGHCFPDLVERERGKIKAEIRSIIWSEQYRRINKKFKEIAKTELQEGMSVLLRGKLNFHPTYGFSIHIYAIDPKFTLGNMAKEKEDYIKKLKQLDLLDLNKKVPFPILPKNLAIISYNTSKGYADFNQVMDEEAKRFSVQYQLFPSLLQGDGATKSLIQQLEYIKNKWVKKFDLVLIIRGGGGDVGMNCYNDFQLCKTIAEFPLPVITGI